MNKLTNECELSFYTTIGTLAEQGNVFLVKSNFTDTHYVKKELDKYNINVYKNLKNNPHKNIVLINDYFEIDDKLVVIEEFISGKTLEALICLEGAVSEEIAKYYVCQICDALIHLHSLNPPVINRDIKLSNIMITQYGQVKLIDFDVAREFIPCRNKDTELLGTAGYAAPEQFGFGQTDVRTDIFALGVVYNYLLTGKHPQEEAYRGVGSEVIRRCINIDPDKRYQNVYELKAALSNKNKSGKAYFNLPGFRTGNPLHKVLAVIYYVLFIGLFIGGMIEDGLSADSVVVNLMLLLTFILIFFLFTEYLSVFKRLPFIKNRNLFVRIIFKSLYSVGIFILMSIVSAYIMGIVELLK